MTLTEIDIREVFATLGGKLKGKRGAAFWRGGKNLSVSVDSRAGWQDHKTGDGGGTLDLVRTALGCDTHAALTWLESNCDLDPRRQLSAREFQALQRQRAHNRRERDDAECFAIAVSALTEDILERMNSTDLRREVFAVLRFKIQWGGAVLLEEFRTWRANHPELTNGLVRAGTASRARMQQRLAFFIQGELVHAA